MRYLGNFIFTSELRLFLAKESFLCYSGYSGRRRIRFRDTVFGRIRKFHACIRARISTQKFYSKRMGYGMRTETAVLYAILERVAEMTEKLHNSKAKDSSSKIIFNDPILCAQFLRVYVDVPFCRDVQPEDIEDVTERFILMFTEERNADTVKRIRMKDNDSPFFLISLIEHKSKVDYNVVMQILRYMVFVWEDYEKEMEKKQKGISRTKGFQYPPILPVIFYDGVEKWTAPKRLKERIFLNDAFSFLALIDKLQNAEEYAGLEQNLKGSYLTDVLAHTPEYLLKLIAQVTGVFLARLNVPEDEVEEFKEKIRGRGMNGELFTRLQAWDVQAIRKEAREEARKEARREIREEVREEARREMREEVQKEKRKQSIKVVIETVKDLTGSAEAARKQLMKQLEMAEEEAEENVKRYW